MAEGTSGTQLWRLEQARNEQLVRAESSLEGEQRVAWARLAMLLMFSLAARADEGRQVDAVRLAVVAAYFLFGLGALFGTRRGRPDPRRAFVLPFLTTVVDFGFLAAMALRSERLSGALRPEMGAVACALILCFSVARSSWIHVVLSTALASATYVALGWQAHLLSGSTPFVVVGFLALGLLILATNLSLGRTFSALRRRDNLARLLPPAVVERVLERGEAALEPQLCEVTVLFSDVRDFTSLSEGVSPRDVLAFLDDYFGRMSQVVKGHDGHVNKFIGDGMLALWGAPQVEPDHATRALAAALDMRRALEELNRDRARRGEAPVRIGVGVHTGPVAAGMLGGAIQHEYTVIGDTVNLASRIEGLTKSLGHDILVSESTWRAVGGRFAGVRVGEERVKGRQEPVVVYALESSLPASARSA